MKSTMRFAAVAVMAALLIGSMAYADVSIPDDLMKAAQAKKGFKPLFKKNLSNALMSKEGWAFEKGVLTSKGKGDIWSKEEYGDFVLDLEFKCAPDTNSGVFLRTSSIADWLNTAIEVQILQPNDETGNAKHHCGGIFDCLAPAKQMVKEAGEWNHYTIIAKGNMIYVVLNDEPIVAMDLDQWPDAGKNPDGTPNKFKYAYKELKRIGHIGLQYHGHPIWFRNLKIKKLGSDS